MFTAEKSVEHAQFSDEDHLPNGFPHGVSTFFSIFTLMWEENVKKKKTYIIWIFNIAMERSTIFHR